MLEKIFHPGQRKIVAFLIGVALTLFGDKIGVPMTEENQTAVLALVGIFTGGNVLSKFAHALIKGAPLVQQAPPVSLSDRQVDAESQEDFTLGEVVRVEKYAQQIAKDATAELNKVHARCKRIEDHMTKQSTSINEILGLINAMKGVPPQGPQGPGRVPTPNELYQG
jgi:hypothetical protein